MKTVIVLAMHGVPPADYPPQAAAEFFRVHGRLEHARGEERELLRRRHEELEDRMRAWPRTPDNDPFYFGSLDLAEHLGRATGCEVVVGFNEYCGPSVDGAIDQSVARGATAVVVITPMMTRGGLHSERDIPASLQRARMRHPGVKLRYAWPFDVAAVAAFLAAQVARSAKHAGRQIQGTRLSR